MEEIDIVLEGEAEATKVAPIHVYARLDPVKAIEVFFTICQQQNESIVFDDDSAFTQLGDFPFAGRVAVEGPTTTSGPLNGTKIVVTERTQPELRNLAQLWYGRVQETRGVKKDLRIRLEFARTTKSSVDTIRFLESALQICRFAQKRIVPAPAAAAGGAGALQFVKADEHAGSRGPSAKRAHGFHGSESPEPELSKRHHPRLSGLEASEPGGAVFRAEDTHAGAHAQVGSHRPSYKRASGFPDFESSEPEPGLAKRHQALEHASKLDADGDVLDLGGKRQGMRKTARRSSRRQKASRSRSRMRSSSRSRRGRR